MKSTPGKKAGRKGREALRQLQLQARLAPDQAQNYLREVRVERLAFEKK